MFKVLGALVLLCGMAFSQNVSIENTHRLYFDIKGDAVVYNSNNAEKSSFTFYISKDTTQASYFVHTIPTMISKYYMISAPTITDSTFEVLVKSDAGNLYKYFFLPKSGYIYAKNIVRDNDSFKSTFIVMFILEPKYINFKKLYE